MNSIAFVVKIHAYARRSHRTGRTGSATTCAATAASDRREVHLTPCLVEAVLLRDGRDDQVPAEFGWKRASDGPDSDTLHAN